MPPYILPYPSVAPSSERHPRNIGSQLSIPRKKNATLACLECKKRKTRCNSGPPCDACVRSRTQCVIDKSTDLRRRTDLTDKLKDIEHERDILNRIFVVLRGGESEQEQWLLGLIRSNASLQEIAIDLNSSPRMTGLERSPYGSQRKQPNPHFTLNPNFGSTNRTTEDYDADSTSRATGFMGKNTDAGWLQVLYNSTQQKGTQAASSTSSCGPNADIGTQPLPGIHDILRGPSTTSMSYSLDDISITPRALIDPYKKPPFGVAEFLARQYFHTVQRYFPIVDEPSFLRQIWSAYNATSDPAPLGDKWPIIMNLVLAISAKFGEAAQVNSSSSRREAHLEYFTRARMSGLSESSLFDHPDLQQLQIEGLTAFYFLASGQTNRAWKISGISVRSAIGLGLNLRTAYRAVSEVSSEIRIRIWWSLWTLGQTLDVMTGRNSEVDLSICNVPLPCPFFEGGFDYRYRHQDSERGIYAREDMTYGGRISPYTALSITNRGDSREAMSSDLDGQKNDMGPTIYEILRTNDSHLFFHYIQLYLISQDVTKNLYLLDTPRIYWPDIESSVSVLWGLTVRWLHQLPCEYRFDHSVVPMESDAMSLGCLFYSVRITITRPSLCRHDRRRSASPEIAAFHRNTAEACVESAKAIVVLFPDEFNVTRLSEAATWFHFVHYLVQAIIVLLIELKFWSELRTSSDEMIRLIEKALRSIWLLSKADASALRAWNLCMGLFRRIAIEQQIDVTDLLRGELLTDSSCFGETTPGEFPTPSDSAFWVDDLVPGTILCTPFDELSVDKALLQTGMSC